MRKALFCCLAGETMIRISKQELLQLPSLLSAMGFRVIAPIRTGGVVKLAPLGPDDQPEVEYIRVINFSEEVPVPDVSHSSGTGAQPR
jgi:hypothetical protein